MELLYLEPYNIKDIEYELNDLLSVANLLYKEKILNTKTYTISTIVLQIHEDTNMHKEIYKCLSSILYHAHKAIRFGGFSSIPSSTKSNYNNMELHLNSLVSYIQHLPDLNIWNINDLLPKQEKVLLNLSIAKKELISDKF